MKQTPDTRIGIDLGGTKIEGVAMDSSGKITQRERLPTPKDDYQAILSAIGQIIGLLTDDPALPVGIGTPGSISRISPLMRNANSTCLNGQPLLHDLQQFLGRDVRIANDADCFTLSEATDGAARSAGNVFGIILGTGVGGGLTCNKQLVSGVNGIAGEWGHNPMPRTVDIQAARHCFCGRIDCVETWLSGPGLQRSYQAKAGAQLTVEAIVAAQQAGSNAATEVLETYCEQLAAALANVINLFDPEIIVLGGGLSNIDMLFDEVPRRLTRYVFSDHVATRLARAEHGDSSGVRGAAWLWD